MKAKQAKAPSVVEIKAMTCVVCGKKTIVPYGRLRGDKCTCSKVCYETYMKGDRYA